MDPATPTFGGRTTLDVGAGEVAAGQIVLRRDRIVTGRIVLDGRIPALDFRAGDVRVRLAGEAGEPAEARVAPDGTFVIRGVAPGAYIPAVRARNHRFDGWVFRSLEMMTNGQPVATLRMGDEMDSHHVTVTLSSAPGTLIVRPRDPSGTSAFHDVLILPAARAMQVAWPAAIRYVRQATDGTVVASGLPPGTYLVAVATLDPDRRDDLDYLAVQLAASRPSTLSLAEGEVKEHVLEVARAR